MPSHPDWLAEKWGIDDVAQAKKLCAFSYPQEIKLLEQIEKW